MTVGRLAMAAGVVSLVLGVVILVWPDATLVVLAVLFGLHLVVVGIRRVVVATRSSTMEGWLRALLGVSGVLILVLGLVCVRNPFTSVAVIAVLVSLGWFIEGVSDLITAVTRPEGFSWLYAIGGVLSVVGAAVILYWPSLTLTILLQVGGWLLIFMGVAEVASQWAGRRADAKAA
ncbi:DUF308 domain-containing protein [Pedococcus sp. KACC 23699]|uniref:DUF308 domain-containing protein n=1 Tax=Pedococcus sp. KACC 23699 TaxID=3149228 RepID=A0AAU7JPJ2_9MICO